MRPNFLKISKTQFWSLMTVIEKKTVFQKFKKYEFVLFFVCDFFYRFTMTDDSFTISAFKEFLNALWNKYWKIL